MKKIQFILLLVFTISSYSQEVLYQCFYSEINPKLQISVKYSDYTAISVKYLGQKKAIPIVYLKDEDLDNDRMTTSIYLEKFKGKVTGKYIIMRNARYTWIDYERKSDKKIFSFVMDEEKTITTDNIFRSSPCF